MKGCGAFTSREITERTIIGGPPQQPTPGQIRVGGDGRRECRRDSFLFRGRRRAAFGGFCESDEQLALHDEQLSALGGCHLGHVGGE
eukprot:scaffold153799_cov29-Tisochrysis_lutea.AAC.5